MLIYNIKNVYINAFLILLKLNYIKMNIQMYKNKY